MKKSPFATFVSTSVVCILAVLAHAAAPTPAKSTVKYSVIQKISADAVTITIGSITRTYKIDKRTIFTYRGQRVTPNDIQRGMRVTVTPAFDNLLAAEIAAGDAPASK